jgi:hypothetical protein
MRTLKTRPHSLSVLFGAWVCISLLSCKSTQGAKQGGPPPATLPQSSATAIAVGSAQKVATPAVAREPGCSIATRQAVDDGGGKPNENGGEFVENVRVVANNDVNVLTWERQTQHIMGDPWRAPVIAIQKGSAPFSILELPVLAYAAASYGYAGTLSPTEPFVTWGVRNYRGFEVWSGIPKLEGPPGMQLVKTKALRSFETTYHQVRGFVVSNGIALGMANASSCFVNCPSFGPLWIGTFSLTDAKAKPAKLAQPAEDNVAPALALAMGDTGGIAAYRDKNALRFVWLDAKGAPTSGTPIVFAEGDVGAPALALAGKTALLVWAQRATKTDAYTMMWQRLDYGATANAAKHAITSTGSGSAFAPGLVFDGKSAVVTWMEGDGESKGEVRMGMLPLNQEAGDSAIDSIVVSEADEKNARDPEISGTPQRPVIAYSAFSAKRPGGIVRLAQLQCGRAP